MEDGGSVLGVLSYALCPSGLSPEGQQLDSDRESGTEYPARPDQTSHAYGVSRDCGLRGLGRLGLDSCLRTHRTRHRPDCPSCLTPFPFPSLPLSQPPLHPFPSPPPVCFWRRPTTKKTRAQRKRSVASARMASLLIPAQNGGSLLDGQTQRPGCGIARDRFRDLSTHFDLSNSRSEGEVPCWWVAVPSPRAGQFEGLHLPARRARMSG